MGATVINGGTGGNDNTVESFIIRAAIVGCGNEGCSKYEFNEEWQNDTKLCAEIFSEGGWAVVDGVLNCPDCMADRERGFKPPHDYKN